MSVAAAINALRRRTRTELNALHDFGAHNGLVWAMIQDTVTLGRTIQFQNPRTGSVVSEQDLLALNQRYQLAYLLPLSFQQLISIFEVFLFDLLKIILVHNPIQLSQRRQTEVREILAAGDWPRLIDQLVDRELNEIKYRKPRDWFEFLGKLVRVARPTADEVDRLAEQKATRDVYAHNSGVANAVYAEKAGAMARARPGDFLDIDPPYFDAAWALVNSLTDDLAAEILARLATP